MVEFPHPFLSWAGPVCCDDYKKLNSYTSNPLGFELFCPGSPGSSAVWKLMSKLQEDEMHVECKRAS